MCCSYQFLPHFGLWMISPDLFYGCIYTLSLHKLKLLLLCTLYLSWKTKTLRLQVQHRRFFHQARSLQKNKHLQHRENDVVHLYCKSLVGIIGGAWPGFGQGLTETKWCPRLALLGTSLPLVGPIGVKFFYFCSMQKSFDIMFVLQNSFIH